MAGGYYLAPSLASLRAEINAAHPNRDKTSDGWIGDAAHAARKSDHNPDYSSGGVVRALDVDKDGIDTAALLRAAIACPSVEYIIWNGKIYTRQNGFKPQVYTGPNKHDKHMHISIRHTKTAEAARKWGYKAGSASSGTTAPPAASSTLPVLSAKEVAALTTDHIYTRTVKWIGPLVDQVLQGKWGNAPERGAKLLAQGWSPRVVQEGVVRRLGRNNAKAPVALSLTVLAQQVIDGKWGNGPERRSRLTAAGYDYDAVQAEVNRLV